MKNIHRFKIKITKRCPYENCGRISTKEITIEYITDQRGNVISKRIV